MELIFSSKIRLIASLIIMIGVSIRIPLIPVPLTYREDIWRQTDTASIAHHFFVNGFDILYPQVYWGGNGPGYVEAEFQLYPYLVALIYAGVGEYTWLGRLVSFLFTVITLILFYIFACQVLKPREVVWALILFVFSPIQLRYGAAFMPEATVMCFYIAALYFFVRWLNDSRSIWLFGASIFTMIAVLVKPTAIHIGLIFLLLAINQYGWGILKERRVWFATILCITPIVFYYLHARSLYLDYGNTFGILSGGDSKFGNLYYWTSLKFYIGIIAIETKWVFTPIAILVFLVGLYHAYKRRLVILIYGVITIGLYFFILARYTGYIKAFQYHVYMLPFAAIGFGIGVESVLTIKSRKLGIIATSFALFSVIGWTATLYPEMVNPPEWEFLTSCAEHVQRLVSTDEYMIVSTFEYSVDIDNSKVPNNYQEPVLFFFSERYGWSLPPDWLSASKIEEFRKQGADYYVILDRDKYLLDRRPDVLDYLNTHARQIEPGMEYGCRIYSFNK
jgi:hypothetical protein